MMISLPNLQQLKTVGKKVGTTFQKGSQLVRAATLHHGKANQVLGFVNEVSQAGTITNANLNRAPKLAANLKDTQEALVTAQQNALPKVASRLKAAGINVKEAETLVTSQGTKKNVIHGINEAGEQTNHALDALVTGKNTARQVRQDNLRTNATEGLKQYQANAQKKVDALKDEEINVNGTTQKFGTIATDSAVKTEAKTTSKKAGDLQRDIRAAEQAGDNAKVQAKTAELQTLEGEFVKKHGVGYEDVTRYNQALNASDATTFAKRQERLNAVLDASEGKSNLIMKGQKPLTHNGTDYTPYYQIFNSGTQKRIAYVQDASGNKFEVDAVGKPTATPFVVGTSKIMSPAEQRTFNRSNGLITATTDASGKTTTKTA
ncbi:MAG: hypothetical protein ACKO37_01775, partial [Vampirovibrionales bacterium]